MRLMAEIQAERDIPFQRQPGQQTGMLESHSDPWMHAGNRGAIHPDLPGIRHRQSGQHAQQAGFSRAAGPEQRNHFTGPEREVQPRQHRPGGAGVSQRDILRGQNPGAHAARPVGWAVWQAVKAVLSCTRLGVTTGRKAASRQRRAKPSPCGER